jgi:hypothetical protein
VLAARLCPKMGPTNPSIDVNALRIIWPALRFGLLRV